MGIYLLIILETVYKAGGPGLSRMRRFVTSSGSHWPGRTYSCVFIFHLIMHISYII